MEVFYRTHSYLLEHTSMLLRRGLMDEIDWDARLIGIKGARGVGKTTFLLQYAKENFRPHDHRCLYINMNNFYFQCHSIAEFAGEFYHKGGRVLLIDQVYKKSDWSKELRKCYDIYPELKIIFTGSSVMRLKEQNAELNGIVKSYNLRGFSFREYLNIETGNDFKAVNLDQLINNHEILAQDVINKVKGLRHYFRDYINHGFYPIYRENRDFYDTLEKKMNMMTEVDILLIKQMELKYLTKIKKLFYLLASRDPQSPNISQLASDIEISRATVMNYIKNLADARLINIIYPPRQDFPKKPSKIMLHNPNLLQAIFPVRFEEQIKMETFFVNTMWKDHKVNQETRDTTYLIDETHRYRIVNADLDYKPRHSSEIIYARYNSEIGKGNLIPLWLFGFLY